MRESETSIPWLRWLLVAALPVYVICLGANSIWDANEAFYVETPRQMITTGDYVTPVFNGALRVNKPVLSYWVVAGLYKVLGISVTAERAGIALGALGIILAAYLVGRTLGARATGLLSALIIATAPRMVMFSRRIFIDIYITLFMALTLACFALAERDAPRRRMWLLLMYVAMGLGVLTKGPVYIAIPALVLAAWWTTERRWRDLSRIYLLPGLLIVAAVVVPWYAALVAAQGWEPVKTFLIGENLDRYTTSLQPGERAIWYYVPVLLGDLFPWAPLVLIPLATAWRRPSESGDAGAPVRRLLWWWIIVFVGVFSLSQSKQDLYIFPIAPAVAALVADTLVNAWRDGRSRAVRPVLALIATLVLIAGPLIYWLFGSGLYVLGGARSAAVVLVLGSVTTLIALRRQATRGAVLALATTFVAFNYLFVAVVLPDMERLKPVVPIAGVLASRARPSEPIGSYQMMLPSLVYYSNRTVKELDASEARDWLRTQPGAWILMSETEWNELRPQLPNICIAARQALFDVKIRDVIDQRRPPDVLLVTNRCEAPVTR